MNNVIWQMIFYNCDMIISMWQKPGDSCNVANKFDNSDVTIAKWQIQCDNGANEFWQMQCQ